MNSARRKTKFNVRRVINYLANRFFFYCLLLAHLIFITFKVELTKFFWQLALPCNKCTYGDQILLNIMNQILPHDIYSDV